MAQVQNIKEGRKPKESKSERVARAANAALAREAKEAKEKVTPANTREPASVKPSEELGEPKSLKEAVSAEKPKKKRKFSAKHHEWLAFLKSEPFKPEMKITLLVQGNPKRERSAKGAKSRFELYKDGMTVQEFVDVNVKSTFSTEILAYRDLAWDSVHGFIKVE